MKQTIREYLLITVGTLLVAAGIYFFKMPNNFTTGGVSGIAILLSSIVPGVSTGTFVLAINASLLVVGFLVLGRGFGIKTVYASLLMSLALRVMEDVLPLTKPLTSQPVLELCYSVLLPAVGSALLFNRGASTGGTDIVAMILRKYTRINIGNGLFVTDVLIAGSALFVFGIETGLFSILGLLAKALVVDNVIESINLSKYFTIVTNRADEITRFIKENLNRGATVMSAQGAFAGASKSVVLTALNRAQAIKLRDYVKQVDDQAFMIIANTSEIIGKGFRQPF